MKNEISADVKIEIATLKGIDVHVDNVGRKYVEWTLKQQNGKELKKRSYCTSARAVSFLTTELERLGLNVTKSSELESEKHLIVGKKIKFSVEEKDDGFPRYIIHGLVDEVHDDVEPKDEYF